MKLIKLNIANAWLKWYPNMQKVHESAHLLKGSNYLVEEIKSTTGRVITLHGFIL